MKFLKRVFPFLYVIPYIIGVTGYILAGETVTNALYAGFAFYSLSQSIDKYNILIEIARWMAPLVTLKIIWDIVKNIWNTVSWWGKSLSGNSIAIYSDEDITIKFDKKYKVIYSGDKFIKRSRSHIILFSSDEKNLKFYEKHKSEMSGKAVYICLLESELGLMKEMKGVSVFDINGSIAGNLWKSIRLWNSGKENFEIAIYGDGALAQNILSKGLQLNLFSNKQRITYHFITDNHLFEIRHENMALMNDDEIIYHGKSDSDVWDVIIRADFVIMADSVKLEMLQTCAAVKKHGVMYYYAPFVGSVGSYLDYGEVRPFGGNEELFTDENIRREGLVKAAKQLNEDYARQYGFESKWENLSGFIKNSNISSADFNEVLASLPEGMPLKEMAKLEHIRWCRFHYLNYWRPETPDTPLAGKNKDTKRRIHKDLVPFESLSSDEIEKDIIVVKKALEKAN